MNGWRGNREIKQNKINLIWWYKAQMSFIEKVWIRIIEEKRREAKRKEEKMKWNQRIECDRKGNNKREKKW